MVLWCISNVSYLCMCRLLLITVITRGNMQFWKMVILRDLRTCGWSLCLIDFKVSLYLILYALQQPLWYFQSLGSSRGCDIQYELVIHMTSTDRIALRLAIQISTCSIFALRNSQYVIEERAKFPCYIQILTPRTSIQSCYRSVIIYTLCNTKKWKGCFCRARRTLSKISHFFISPW